MEIAGEKGIDKKNPLSSIISTEKLQQIEEVSKKYFTILKVFFGNKVHEKMMVGIGASITAIVLGYSIFTLVTQIQDLDKGTKTLEKISGYNIQALKDRTTTQSIGTTANTVDDLLKANENIQAEVSRYESHKKELQSSYDGFFKYLLVPKLNIRKELYTDKININIIGGNFLEQNPFSDINLYQKWSNFFESTDQNQVNTINNLEIGDITETDFGLYKIKLSFGFVAPSKNALLFLVDKISMTSDKENISLLGEFVYYLRQEIKGEKQDEIQKIGALEINKDLGKDQDKIIGKTIYNRISNNDPSTLIDNAVIDKTIKSIMGCSSESQSECFYKFRDKYRNIAELAYPIGSTTNTNKTEDLRLFFKNMPPLMAVQTFTFDKKEGDQVLDPTAKYEGRIELEIYGQNISADEMQEITKTLGKKCFGDNKNLSLNLALTTVNNNIQAQGNDDGGASANASNLKTILEGIDKEYATANNYKKTIRLFEVYRMLNEGGFCTTI
ncbi:MAG: hypothetical protein WCO66_02845 [Candidatus Absconditabacteria bacterium]